MIKPRLQLLSLCLLLLLLFPPALLTGSVEVPARKIWCALFGDADTESLAYFVVWQSRLPSMLTAVLAGGSLAVSGLVMQTLFSNPLADPSLLGVNSGASLGAALALMVFQGYFVAGEMTLAGAFLTLTAAFLGAMAVIFLLTAFSRYLRDTLSLLVAGVMISFAISAVISLLNFYASAEDVRSFVIWGMGDFTMLTLSDLPMMAVLTLVPAVLLLMMSRPLNALLLGEDYAANLGVSVRRVRTVSLVLVGLLTATVTATCGPVSFIGLAVPHMARLLLRTADHRRLLPATLLLGSSTALLSLMLTRLPEGGRLLPLSAITPLIGVPVVLYILLKRK